MAAVGIPMYEGYIATTKVNAKKVQHHDFVKFMASSFIKCSSDVNNSISLVRYPSGKTENISCSNTAKYFADSFHLHFHYLYESSDKKKKSIYYKNPYAMEKAMWNNSNKNPPIGRSYIYGWDGKNNVRLISNTGDTGTNKFISSHIYKE